MRISLNRSEGREILIVFAAGAAVLCASLANFLAFNNYPYLRPEVGFIVAGFLLIATLMAPFYCAQRRWGRAVLEGFLAATFVDLNSSSVVLALAAGLSVAALALWRRQSLLGPIAVIATFVLITTALGFGKSSTWIRTANSKPIATSPNRPETTVVHLILDEHIGIGGLAINDPKAAVLQRDLEAFYLNSGFVLYRRAYSEHMHTVNAIPHILNYGHRLARQSSSSGVIAGPTEHLSGLQNKGYALTVFQSDFADFCTGMEKVRCITYGASSLYPTLSAPLSPGQRAQLIAFKFASLSQLAIGTNEAWKVLKRASWMYGIQAPEFDLDDAGRSSSVSALAALDSFAAIARHARPGEAYFFHVLLPHYPYVVRSDCSFLPWPQWKMRLSVSKVAARQHAYYDQVHCTMRKVKSILDALSKAPAGRGTIVIIHGDHGSRITQVDPNGPNIGHFGDADVIAAFSTLFAIKASDLKPTFVDEPLPAAALLKGLSGTNFQSLPQPGSSGHPMVYLDDWDWKVGQRVPLPESWTKGVDRPASGH